MSFLLLDEVCLFNHVLANLVENDLLRCCLTLAKFSQTCVELIEIVWFLQLDVYFFALVCQKLELCQRVLAHLDLGSVRKLE